MLETVQRLIREASRPDRLFPIRSEKYYGHYAGQLPDGRQALVTFGYERVVRVYLFSRDGDYLGLQRRRPTLDHPPEEASLIVNDRQLHEFLADEFGFIPGLIHVKRFVEPAELVSIEPVPSYLKEFADGLEEVPDDERQYHFAELVRWVDEGDFVLNTWNDYWLDKNGEVSSS